MEGLEYLVQDYDKVSLTVIAHRVCFLHKVMRIKRAYQFEEAYVLHRYETYLSTIKELTDIVVENREIRRSLFMSAVWSHIIQNGVPNKEELKEIIIRRGVRWELLTAVRNQRNHPGVVDFICDHMECGSTFPRIYRKSLPSELRIIIERVREKGYSYTVQMYWCLDWPEDVKMSERFYTATRILAELAGYDLKELSKTYWYLSQFLKEYEEAV
jgi:hypothetical protein